MTGRRGETAKHEKEKRQFDTVPRSWVVGSITVNEAREKYTNRFEKEAPAELVIVTFGLPARHATHH